MQVAQNILNQLGGRKFIVMTGSKNFVADGNTLRMKLTANNAKAQYLSITLNSLDTYDMVFFSVDKAFNVVEKKRVDGAYNDMLQSVFTSVTGLYTSL
jgi:hypothetical protein